MRLILFSLIGFIGLTDILSAQVISASHGSATYGTFGGGGGLMPPQMAASLGLEEAWVEAMTTPHGGSSLVDAQIFVDSSRIERHMELVTKSKTGEEVLLSRVRLAPMMPDGTPSPAEAEQRRLASLDMMRFKRRGYDVMMRDVETPQLMLYGLSENGTLERREAETGRMVWHTAVGNPNLRYGTLGVGDFDVIVDNGGNLLSVRTDDGKVVEKFPTRRTARFGAIVSGRWAIVHTIGGNIEAYEMTDLERDPYIDHVRGNALARPVRVPGTYRLGWPTTEGFVYVMELQGTPSTLFRLKTDGLVGGGLAADDKGHFYFASERGQAYALKATKSGIVLWTESLGVPFRTEPVVAGDRVLLTSDYGEVYCLSTETGERLWDRPIGGISKILGAFSGIMYATDSSGDFVAYRLDSGSRIPMAGRFRPERIIVNRITNRLYFVNDAGLLQCIRPLDSPLPKFLIHANPVSTADLDAFEETPVDAGGQDGEFVAPKEKNPFGGGNGLMSGGDDPFGAGGDGGMGGGDDPFGAGGGDDPFGGGGGMGGGDDPFGAGSGDDPFGGSGGNDPFGGG